MLCAGLASPTSACVARPRLPDQGRRILGTYRVGTEAITTPPGAPQANAFAERWVRSVRHELLDRTIVWNERQLRSLLEQYVTHYNQHRPHRSLRQRAPSRGHFATIEPAVAIERHGTCGGLINEYRPAA